MRGEVVRGSERVGGTYRDLVAWQVGVDLAVACYELTKQLPDDERFGLSSQIRRASVSVPANVAEGYGRQSDQDFARFLKIAQGSLKEVETHVIIAIRVDLLTDHDARPVFELCDRLGKVLRGLIRSLGASQ